MRRDPSPQGSPAHELKGLILGLDHGTKKCYLINGKTRLKGDQMLIQTKVQLDEKHYRFVKQAYKDLKYRSLSEYVRDAVDEKIKKDRKKLRERMRQTAMEGIGKTAYENLFEDIEGNGFEGG